MRWFISLMLFTALCVAPVQSGFYEDLYRGLGYFATPTGSPVTGATGGGLSNGSRFGRLRIVPNDFGNGYRLELDRTFGSDTRGRPETFDLGPLELTLNGSMQSTVQYTSRLLPTVNVDIFANNMQYLLSTKSGAQDFSLSGTLNVNHQLEVSRLGFYYLTMEITQTNSELTADGIVVDGTVDSDYNIGPITVRGNVFVDMAAAALNGFGLDASGLEQLFPASPIARINDEITAFIDRQRQVLSAYIEADMADGTLSDQGALAARDFVTGLAGIVDETVGYTAPLNIPESSSLLLIGTMALITLRRRL